MAETQRNKQTVARLFDAFRDGDVEAFDELIVEEFVQHNPQVGNGLQALKDFSAPLGPVDVDVRRVIAEGDLVAVHSNYKTWNMAGGRNLPPQRRRQDHRALGRPPTGPGNNRERQRHVLSADVIHPSNSPGRVLYSSCT